VLERALVAPVEDGPGSCSSKPVVEADCPWCPGMDGDARGRLSGWAVEASRVVRSTLGVQLLCCGRDTSVGVSSSEVLALAVPGCVARVDRF
jgi:hypothetical protein